MVTTTIADNVQTDSGDPEHVAVIFNSPYSYIELMFVLGIITLGHYNMRRYKYESG